MEIGKDDDMEYHQGRVWNRLNSMEILTPQHEGKLFRSVWNRLNSMEIIM